jgi:hypothetical protein
VLFSRAGPCTSAHSWLLSYDIKELGFTFASEFIILAAQELIDTSYSLNNISSFERHSIKYTFFLLRLFLTINLAGYFSAFLEYIL